MTKSAEQLESLLQDLVRAVAADAGAGLYLDDGEGMLQLVAQTKARGQLVQGRWRRPKPVADRGRTLLVAVPDVRGGVLVLEREGRDEFTSDDQAVARLYARQLAQQVTVEGARPRSTIWTRQLEAIQNIAAQLTRLTSVAEVAMAICVEIGRVIEHDNARVYVVAEDGVTLEPVAFRSVNPAYAGETAEGLRIRVGEGVTGWVAARGQPLIVPDASRDARVVDVPGTPGVVEESMLLVPLRHENRVTGVIVLSRLGVGRFDLDNLRLLQVLCDQAAVAIENAKLHASRERLVGELAVLLEISQATQLADDQPELARVLAEKLAKASHADACVISRLDEGSTHLRTLGVHGSVPILPSYDILEYPLTRRVLRDSEPAVVQVAASEADPAEVRLLQGMGAKSLLMMPLAHGGRIAGLVELFSLHAPHEYTPSEISVYRTMANQAATVLENARLVEQLRQAADVDQVTGVNNHRYLQERLKQEAARSSRSRAPFSVLMIDLDGFKAVNDKHGHADGDRVLRNVANDLKLAVRTNDVVARYGGDEFVVLMPDTGEGQAKAVARRVVDGVRNRRHLLSDGYEATVSASAGLAVYPEDGRTPRTLLQAADVAMYAVKRSGGSDVRRGTRGMRAQLNRAPLAVASGH
jgi:diguanylate cyclase (GGDEF)-like protein